MKGSLVLWDVPRGRWIPTGRPIGRPSGRPTGIQAIAVEIPFVELVMLQAVCDTPVGRIAGCVSSIRI